MILVTACTQRKTSSKGHVVRPVGIAKGPLERVAQHWVASFRASPTRVAARELYKGQAPALARDAEDHGVHWFIASAGAGLISAASALPIYDCTVQGRTANILRRVTDPRRVTAAQWWSAVTAAVGKPLALRSLLLAARSDTVCIALPESYWKMIEAECRNLPPAARERIRLFRAPGLPAVDAEFAQFVMPYDARLEGENSRWRGARGSFAVRAAHHFVTTIAHRSPGGDAARHSAMVEEALSEWRAPEKPKPRAPVSDRQVKKLIRELQRQGINAPTTQLRQIRTTWKFACERSRFERLRREVLHA